MWVLIYQDSSKKVSENTLTLRRIQIQEEQQKHNLHSPQLPEASGNIGPCRRRGAVAPWPIILKICEDYSV
ncbi:hypothetical protein B5X24_HaOG213547 [Helicoverpa armigera]|nr:hypothetical protein B5X24_HaOG213547 [Helicoverpa armigera]